MRPQRCGMGAISDNVRLVEHFGGHGGRSLLVALCSVEGCGHLANGFRDANVPVCFYHRLPSGVARPEGGAR